VICPACGHSNAAAQRFCGQCGAVLDAEAQPTRTSPAPPAGVQPRTIETPAAGRFIPGAMLAGRYRMVGLLGRGGMGEVYRADDLKLGQPVALKFLPRDVEGDPERLERFLTEVRLSLRVTHPNVCRVFDIAQVDGRHFLSMEYVDGEDLASLLRRIGRLPEDKAVEIARQLCAGLSAAHDEGVLHRDLKPANVMIDGRGRAKITDFGLAGATAGISGVEARAGTPQYMAPEQASGGALSAQTDLYALGLVLYELFTGKRAFDVKSLEDLTRMRSSTPTSPAALVSGLHPAVERAILRCLQPDPSKRPSSASALAAALPGGDPLAMAIAAGETPSPEMVAQAGGTGALPIGVATVCLVVLLAGLAATWILAGWTTVANRVGLPKPPAELVVQARALIAAAGYTSRPASSAFGFERDGQYFDSIERDDRSPGRWDQISSVVPAPVWFWYREGPTTLAPLNLLGTVGPDDPPLIATGMVRARLDSLGRLVHFRAVPPDRAETPGPWAEPDWTRFLTAANLDPSTLVAADPQWAPPVAVDARRAWTRDKLRIEAGSFHGRIMWLTTIPPWRQAATGTPEPAPVSTTVGRNALQLASVLVIGAAAFLARRNIRNGRSDRRGAFRFAVVYVALGTIADLLRMHPTVAWFYLAQNNFALQVYWGLIVWLFYVALEPYVRRLWPNTLIAWTRALDGRLRDPLVGRHVLFGGLAGLVFTLNFLSPAIVPRWFGLPPAPPEPGGLVALGSMRAVIAAHFANVQQSFFIPVMLLLTLLLLRVILRRPWLAYAAALVVSALFSLTVDTSGLFAITMVVTGALVIVVLTRYGLLAFTVGIIFSSWDAIPLTTNPDSWYFGASLMSMLVFAGIAIYGFVVSLGGQKVFKDPVLD
jgi:serine/threonine-protein kinase